MATTTTEVLNETGTEQHAPEPPRVRGTGHRWVPFAICSALYLLVSLLWYGHLGSLGKSDVVGMGGPDQISQIWWLGWVADNLPHLNRFFFATGLNYPSGQNFGVQGSMLALGVLFAPITKLFGVTVTWNLAIHLAPAVSAAAMCFVLRRWTTWWPAAFIGGLLYGFSPYQQHLSQYLFLIFVPLPPLFFLLLHEILVRQKWSPRTAGLLLGLVCVLQFFVFTEILASMVIIGVIAVILYVLTHLSVVRERWRYALVAFGHGIGFTALLLVYPVAFTFAGPQHIHGAPDASIAPYFQTDLFALVYPIYQWLGSSSLGGMSFSMAASSGEIYVGIPLLAVLFLAVFAFRKNRAILFAAIMALIACVLSLGTHLWIDGHYIGWTLPFAVLGHFPLLNALTASRFSLYTSLFVAAVVALAADEIWKRAKAAQRARKRTGQPGFLRTRWHLIAGATAVSAMALIVTLPWIPAWTVPSVAAKVPTFFTSDGVAAVPDGSVLLAYPYPDTSSLFEGTFGGFPGSAMLDQAVAEMRFQLIGGFGWFPAPRTRAGTTNPAVLRPLTVQALFDVAYVGGTPAERALVSKTSRATLEADLRTYLRKYRVETVLCLPLGQWRHVASVVTSAIGPPVESGGVTVWLGVQNRLSDRHA